MVVREHKHKKKTVFADEDSMSTIEKVEYYIKQLGMSQQEACKKVLSTIKQSKNKEQDKDSRYADLFKENNETVNNSVDMVKNSVVKALSRIGVTKPNYKVTYTNKGKVNIITVYSNENNYINSFQFVLPEQNNVLSRLIKMFVEETKGLL